MVGSKDNSCVLVPDESVGRYPFSWLALSGIVFLCVLWQFPGESQDWQNYDGFFELLRTEGFGIFSFTRFEPAFVIISLILSKLLSSNLAVYGVIAASALLLKSWVINRFSTKRWIFYLAALFYFARFAPLHELTQIRVACSSALLLTAYVLLLEGNRLGGLIACAAALSFHLTSIFIIPLLFVQYSTRRSMVIAGAGVYCITLVGLGFLVNYLEDSLRVVMAYQEVGFGDELSNPLSSSLLLDWAMLLTGLLLWRRISPSMKQILFIELIGMALVYSSLDFPVVSHRMREMFSVFWVLFVAQGLQCETSVKFISVLFAIGNIVLYTYLYYYHNPLFL